MMYNGLKKFYLSEIHGLKLVLKLGRYQFGELLIYGSRMDQKS